MNQFVTSIMVNSIVLRANRLHESFEWFRKYDAEYAETLREYNAAYRAFLSMVKSLRGGQGISGRASRSGAYPNNYLFNDVLLYSGLAQYVNVDGKRARSGITNLARIIDNHVMAVSDAKLKEYEESFAELDRQQKAARSFYDKAVDAVSKLPGADALGTIGVDDSQILDNVDRLAAQAIAEIVVLRDPELTPLRTNKNVAPDAFKVAPLVQLHRRPRIRAQGAPFRRGAARDLERHGRPARPAAPRRPRLAQDARRLEKPQVFSIYRKKDAASIIVSRRRFVFHVEHCAGKILYDPAMSAASARTSSSLVAQLVQKRTASRRSSIFAHGE
ncbi:hypothetical protein RAH42_09250 [Pyramidobacter sp. YE332]|uniref:hypothetical protein n=1 Tax=Pyramidobacter sp. YE332 TaxID=3068894 RepID=UPI00294B8353|nr:hypothetical protein [Pyramidobacter sp. YE332]WOL39327.1 hypothetical protein RAH42_09250 [Pyramidobacter sp. YE332]